MSADDVVRTTWGDTAVYTVHDEQDGGLVVVLRRNVTHDLFCARCQTEPYQPCKHVTDVRTYIHRQPKAG